MSFLFNDPDILGQTVFIKRGPHQGKIGLVKEVLNNDVYMVTGADFGKERAQFKRKEFIVHRYRKIRMRSS
ncbi:DUF3912 family protein [Aliidiomarina taiwanensis]|uniref:DUF3912 family protein n=1 Tax=Aliidiomarina taiwanensis TaxID=946228 RepID=UPI001F542CB2|nr:DUF3912 family protein [Aliidiomarina taiwanensis]